MMKNHKTQFALIYFFLIGFCGTGFCGKIIYPWNAATAIVKAGENVTVWFNADEGQTVTSAKLRGPCSTVSIPLVARQTGSWQYDEISGNMYNTRIAITVPAGTPQERYDLILNTTAEQEISHGAVKVVREYKTDYTIMHISDTHLCQGAKINGLPNGLFKISAMVDIANIIGPEMVFITGDLINDNMFPPQERADLFYKGSEVNGLKGVCNFHAASFSAAGNHDFLQQSQTSAGFYPEKSKFWNQYHGLHYHHFKYGNTRYMIVNTGWEGFDWAYQLKEHISWLADVGPGNLRIAAYHKSENGIMGAWADTVNLGLAMIGHNHHLAGNNPYELGGRRIQYYANSTREHFAFNLFRIHSDGSYTAVNNREFVENPSDAPSLWRPKLKLAYAKANDGTARTNTATLINNFDVGFPNARVRFLMPKGNTYSVSKGTVEQAFDGDSMHVVDVQVAIDPNSMNTIEIYPSGYR
ncbi:MAG: hypothetical protein JXB18_05770 [Sedimentisphaerales bacterium]|nr:hypothetical protein [Sedimentisphaerales bacterium]